MSREIAAHMALMDERGRKQRPERPGSQRACSLPNSHSPPSSIPVWAGRHSWDRRGPASSSQAWTEDWAEWRIALEDVVDERRAWNWCAAPTLTAMPVRGW